MYVNICLLRSNIMGSMKYKGPLRDLCLLGTGDEIYYKNDISRNLDTIPINNLYKITDLNILFSNSRFYSSVDEHYLNLLKQDMLAYQITFNPLSFFALLEKYTLYNKKVINSVLPVILNISNVKIDEPISIKKSSEEIWKILQDFPEALSEMKQGEKFYGIKSIHDLQEVFKQMHKDGESFLHYVVRKNYVNLSKSLLDYDDGININVVNNYNQTLLSFVKSQEMLKLLRSKNIDENIKDIYGKLWFENLDNAYEVILDLIKHNQLPNNVVEQYLYNLLKNHDIHNAHKLIQKGYQVDFNLKTIVTEKITADLSLSTETQKHKIIMYLMEHNGIKIPVEFREAFNTTHYKRAEYAFLHGLTYKLASHYVDQELKNKNSEGSFEQKIMQLHNIYNNLSNDFFGVGSAIYDVTANNPQETYSIYRGITNQLTAEEIDLYFQYGHKSGANPLVLGFSMNQYGSQRIGHDLNWEVSSTMSTFSPFVAASYSRHGYIIESLLTKNIQYIEGKDSIKEIAMDHISGNGIVAIYKMKDYTVEATYRNPYYNQEIGQTLKDGASYEIEYVHSKYHGYKFNCNDYAGCKHLDANGYRANYDVFVKEFGLEKQQVEQNSLFVENFADRLQYTEQCANELLGVDLTLQCPAC